MILRVHRHLQTIQRRLFTQRATLIYVCVTICIGERRWQYRKQAMRKAQKPRHPLPSLLLRNEQHICKFSWKVLKVGVESLWILCRVIGKLHGPRGSCIGSLSFQADTYARLLVSFAETMTH